MLTSGMSGGGGTAPAIPYRVVESWRLCADWRLLVLRLVRLLRLQVLVMLMLLLLPLEPPRH